MTQESHTVRRPVRIANCSGFYGDRPSAMAEVLRGGDVDVITGDYLAEVTMLVLAKNRLKDPDAGYARTFEKQIEPLLEEIAARGVKVVVNAGGLAPATLATRLRATCAARGVSLRIAHIEGDNILPRINSLKDGGHQLAHLDTGAGFDAWGYTPLTANAYLGAWGIVAALDAGADIVICPRVTDASVIVGPAAWWHGWSTDAWDALAGAVAAGHVIECGTQATGGNYSAFTRIGDLIHPGFPLAEISADGSAIITKHAGTGGAVTTGTVSAQLLYEVQGLDYLNPDVTTRLDTVELEDLGDDRVRISGTSGAPPPATTKVAITAFGGFTNSTVYVLTGLDAQGKAELFETALRARLKHADISELQFELIGGINPDPADQLAATTFLRVSVKGSEKAVGRGFFDASVELALASYPGLFSVRTDARNASAFGVYWPALLNQDVLEHLVVLDDGSRIAAARPPRYGDVEQRTSGMMVAAEEWGETKRAPLGWVVDARSGDKGGNGNVGLWTRDQTAYRWLAATLTSERLRDLLPEARGLAVERYELPNLRALNFVIKGLLNGGATETLRFDSQAKALGEYIRAKLIPIPVRLLEAAA